MGNRLSRIVTRTGDNGTTALGDGTRVPKDGARIEAMGSVDELNSVIGLLVSTLPGVDDAAATAASAWLPEVQQALFDMGAELSVPGLVRLDEKRIDALEQRIEELNAALPPLKEFVLPGGSAAASVCHLARTVCRRAERRGWALARDEEATRAGAPSAAAAPSARGINTVSLRYLNRLSDLLFVLARTLARAGSGQEVLWRNTRHK